MPPVTLTRPEDKKPVEPAAEVKEKAPAVESKAPEKPEETSNSPDITDEDWSNLADDVPSEVTAQQTDEDFEEPEAETIPERVDTSAEEEAEAEPEPVVEPTAETETKPVVPSTPTQKPITGEEIARLWEARETSLRESYRISEEEGNAFLTDAEDAIPRLAAKIQVNAEQAIWIHLNEVLPDILARVQQQQQSVIERDTAFYNAFPKIRDRVQQDESARLVVENMRNLFQQHNPEMSLEELNAHVGAAAMVALKIPFTEETPATTSGKGKKVVQPPHRPAATRTASTARAPKLGAMESYAIELAEEDAGSSVTY